MPIEPERYPKNWQQFTLEIKDSTEWTCEKCGKPCRKTGELLSSYILRRWGNEYGQIAGTDWIEAVDFPQRFTLTSAHLDQNPGNNDKSNLKALCTACHLKNDRPFKKRNSTHKKERKGQKKLF